MTHKTLFCLALLVNAPAFAETSQAELERRLGVLSVQPARTGGTGAGDLGPAAGVPKVDCMPAALDDKANIDERLAWARSVKACLKASISTLQTTAAANPAALGPAVARQNEAAAVLADVEERIDTIEGEKDFMGLKWGIGIGYSHGFDDIIDEAEIVDGVVRVKKDLTEQPRVIFEFHNYRWCHRKGRSTGDDLPVKTGCGPFAAVATRDDKILSGVAAGWMYGWKTGTGTDATGFSVGVGVIVDSGGKVLGEGFKDGEAPPPGATEVLLKEKAVASGVIFFTRTF